jgi:hypothetical protein
MPRVERVLSRVKILAGCCLVLAAGCARVPQQTHLQERLGSDVSAQAMRVRVIELGRYATSKIEESADSIRRESAEPQVWRNGLLWKMNSGPAVREATLQQDPLGAAAESYVFLRQMREFFQQGVGKDAFGNAQPIAINALRRLEQDAASTVALGFQGDTLPARILQRLNQWAADHPLTTMIFQHPAVSPDWLVLSTEMGSGLGGTAFRLDQALSEMNQRVAYISDNMMKQLIWQMQLLGGDALGRASVDSALLAGRTAVDRVTRLADTLPSLMERERSAVLSNVDSQRVATLLALSDERAAVFAGIDRERVATINDLRGERIAAMAAMDTMIASAFERTDRLVDRVMLRAAQLVVLLLVATLVVVVAVRVNGRAHERRRSFRAA